MREYINIHQLDDIGSNARENDYLILSQDALPYKLRVGEFRNFVIDGIDTTLPIYNANQLLGNAIEFTEPLSDDDLLTYDSNTNSWINKPLDIDFVFSGNEFESNKFIKLNANKEVITSDVYVEDLVVDTNGVADSVLAVSSSGGNVVYLDIYTYINETIDERSDTFIPLLNQEIDRATNEESRIETLLVQEINRATNEELRIENKFDQLISDEVDTLNSTINSKELHLSNRIDSEITRATGEEERIDDRLTDEINRATNEEERIENKFDSLISSEVVRIEGVISTGDSSLLTTINNEVNRATNEESRIEDLVDDVNSRVDSEITRATNEERRLENMLIDLDDYVKALGNMWFPVGSVLHRRVNPGTSVANGGMGFGTWTKISGRSLIGTGTYNDGSASRSFTEGSSYGTFEETLSVDEMPSHDHSGSTSSAGQHNHTGGTDTQGGHTHTGTASSAGQHNHELFMGGGSSGPRQRLSVDTYNDGHGYIGTRNATEMGGEHTHDISLNFSGNHAHSLTINSNGSHTHTVTVGNTGGGDAHNNLHPVFAVDIWYRTA